jgi:hypothetical protein
MLENVNICVDFFERMWKMWIILNGNNGKSGKMCVFPCNFLKNDRKSGKNEREITVKVGKCVNLCGFF